MSLSRFLALTGPVWRFVSLGLVSGSGWAAEGSLGLFSEQGDVGRPTRAGSARYDAATQTYALVGGGENMWADRDALHFVWRRVSGDLALTADIAWVTREGNPHRKACLLVRQSLEPGSVYADAAVHGDGLTSLQFRADAGGPTREIQANGKGFRTVRLERDGDCLWLSVATSGGALQPAGGAVRLRLQDPVYVGLGVCAHDDQALAEARFSRVQLENRPHEPTTNRVVESTLEIVPIASKDRRAILHVRDHLEAPNWSRDGQSLVYNSRGRLYRLPVTGGQPEPIDTGFAVRCNNDHGFSPDGTELALSDQTETGQSLIYLVSAAGGTPRKVTAKGPSYWHGWSPDGRTLTYCAERGGAYDVYTIPVEGGEERRLTTAAGLDDGPEYSPDGRWIYFNSERTDRMQIWRMRPDGSGQEQVTKGDDHHWFPHPSPDGRWIVFLAYRPEVKGHPANQDVELRLLPTDGGPIQVLARLFGGQGTINVPSWSPDSRQVAFVSYRLARTPASR